MTYLVGKDLPATPAGQRFKDMMHRKGIMQIPGAHNGQAALQAKDCGFGALYLSGAAMTASMGLPDLGIITIDEVCFSSVRLCVPRACPCWWMEIPGMVKPERDEHGPRV